MKNRATTMLVVVFVGTLICLTTLGVQQGRSHETRPLGRKVGDNRLDRGRPAKSGFGKMIEGNAAVNIENEAALLVAMAERMEKQNRYRGMSARPRYGAQGEELALQQEIAHELNRQDFVPAERLEHFQWLKRQGLELKGWSGQIAETVQGPDGVRVKFVVQPDTGSIQTADRVTEYYLYRNHRLELVGFEHTGLRELDNMTIQ